jgi:hypothetical protein
LVGSEHEFIIKRTKQETIIVNLLMVLKLVVVSS